MTIQRSSGRVLLLTGACLLLAAGDAVGQSGTPKKPQQGNQAHQNKSSSRGHHRPPQRSTIRTMRDVRPITNAARSANAGSSGAQASIFRALSAMSPSVYWPLEHSFTPARISDAGSWANVSALTFSAFECNGPTNDFASYTRNEFEPVTYLPMLPDHQTVAKGTPALVFSENIGDPDGVERRLAIEPWDGPRDTMLEALGLEDSWTIHLVAYPEPDPNNERPNEVLLAITSAGTTFELRCDARADELVFEAFLEGAADDEVSVRATLPASQARSSGHQLIVRFERAARGLATLSLDVDDTHAEGTMRGRLVPGDDQAIHIGANARHGAGFHGALHHLAMWDSTLDQGAMNQLAHSLRTPEDRPALAIDWDASPTFYMWTLPNDRLGGPNQASTGARNIEHWFDPIWRLPGVYPMVRVDVPNWLPEYGPASLAQATAHMIGRLEGGLNLIGKSLTDGPGYSLFWHGAGTGTYNYSDYETPARVSLMRNWRDVPYEQRQNSRNGRFERPDEGWELQSQIYGPFYREGMSMNAFIGAEAYRQLAGMLDSIPTTAEGGMPGPSRMHYAWEHYALNFYATNGDGLGWWDQSIDDPRAADPRFWHAPDQTLATMNEPPNTNRTPWHHSNIGYLIESNGIMFDSAEHAMYEAYARPAERVFGHPVRISNYYFVAAGDFDPSSRRGNVVRGTYPIEEMRDNPVGRSPAIRPIANAGTEYFDFSAPALYPGFIKSNYTQFMMYWTNIGEPYEMEHESVGRHHATHAMIEEDLTNFLIECRKHDVNASYLATIDRPAGPKPIAPWLRYASMPSGLNDAGTNKLVFERYRDGAGDPINFTPPWQAQARMMVFAHRRGAREFMLWGGLDATDPAYAHTVARDTERAIRAVLHVAADWRDFTTTGHTDRVAHDNFGVPDGVIDQSDVDYFLARWEERDMEADIAGRDGRPDGVVDNRDRLHYLTYFIND